MNPSTDATRRRPPEGLDIAAIGVVAVLVAVTVAMLALPGVSGHVVAPGLDIALDTVATVATGTVAVLAWGLYAEQRKPVAHAEAAAFLALAIVNGVAVIVAITGFPDSNEGLLHVGEDQAFVFTSGRFLAAALLVFGGISSLRGHPPGYPVPMLVAPAIIVGVVIAVVEIVGDRLPELLMSTPGLVAGVTVDATTTPFGAVVQLAGAALTMAAAVVWRGLWQRDRTISHAYLALGLIVASFAQLHTVLYPSIHPLQVSSGDLLWTVFAVILVLAIEAESRTTLVDLRTANASLEELRDVEVERAALEERARLSRELHDGLAQDLWLAKLKVGRLSALPDLGAEATLLSDELQGAIDDGLAEARQAVMALRLGTGGSHAPLCEMMHRFADDFADRVGVRTDFECDHSAPRLSHRTEAEVLRIAQEALNNVRRHADATLVRVKFETRDGVVWLAVGDNGKGFDPASVARGGYGLAGMRERAALIGGHLTIDSRPLDGTRITVEVPVDSAPVPDRVRV